MWPLQLSQADQICQDTKISKTNNLTNIYITPIYYVFMYESLFSFLFFSTEKTSETTVDIYNR